LRRLAVRYSWVYFFIVGGILGDFISRISNGLDYIDTLRLSFLVGAGLGLGVVVVWLLLIVVIMEVTGYE
jgi:hypothetical protein